MTLDELLSKPFFSFHTFFREPFQLKNLTIMTDSRAEYDIINRLSQGFLSKRVFKIFSCYQKIEQNIQTNNHQCFFILDEYNQFCDKITKSIFHTYEKEYLSRDQFYFNPKIFFQDKDIKTFHGILEVDNHFLKTMNFDEISSQLKNCFSSK